MDAARLTQLRRLSNYATYVGAGRLAPDAGDDMLELCNEVDRLTREVAHLERVLELQRSTGAAPAPPPEEQ